MAHYQHIRWPVSISDDRDGFLIANINRLHCFGIVGKWGEVKGQDVNVGDIIGSGDGRSCMDPVAGMEEFTQVVVCVESRNAESLACYVSSLQTAEKGRRIDNLDLLDGTFYTEDTQKN